MTVSWHSYGILDATVFPPVIQDDMLYLQVEYSINPTFSTKIVSAVEASTTDGICVLLVKHSAKYYY